MISSLHLGLVIVGALVISVLGACTAPSPFEFQGSIPMAGELIYKG